MKFVIMGLVFMLSIPGGYFAVRQVHTTFYSKASVLASITEADQKAAPPTFTPSPTVSLTPTLSPSPTPVTTRVPTVSPMPTLSPTPTPIPTIVAPSDLEPLFTEFASLYKVDITLLKKIADCESHFNRAVSAPPYAGMYQFTSETWQKYRNQMGLDPNSDLRYGARESIETAAFVLSVGGAGIWPVCSR